MPPVIIETPGAFASLKAWERYRERLALHSDGGEGNPSIVAADRWIAHLREKEASSARRRADQTGGNEP